MSALSTHHKANQERSKNREEQRSKRELEQVTKARKKQEQVTRPSKDRFPQTRAAARRNRSNTSMTPQRQRQGSTQSCRSDEETRSQTKQKLPLKCISPSHVQHSPHVCTLKALCTTSFCSNTNLLPLVGTCTHQG